MSMTEVIESIEKEMWEELKSRSIPEAQPKAINISGQDVGKERYHGAGSKND